MHNLEGIAIVGMAGRFPGAKNLKFFWDNLCNGVESITHFAKEELLEAGISEDLLSDPNYVKANGFLEDVDLFDADYFGYNPREAQILDPQQRIFLECAKEALDDAAYDPQRYQGLIGLFAGTGGFNTYLRNNLRSNRELFNLFGAYQIFLANEKDFLSTRASYKLNLKGPALTVQTACSTSLVAVHVACQNLLSYQCDMALAGGVRVSLPQKTGYMYQEGSILSPDGHCRPFDAKAQGTVAGEGVGLVVLKRFEEAAADNDHIYAVIKGSAYNNDGSDKAGYTAPSVNGQTEAISMALAVADVDPDSVGYVETHGTGTLVGDPIEISALTEAYRRGTGRNTYCAIGALKGNIGHTDTAAGVAGLIKTALILKHKKIPPSLHFEEPNPVIDFPNSPFYVNTKLKHWESDGPRRAGVSAFGLGGTNAHVVMEEYQDDLNRNAANRSHHLVVMSGKSPEVIDQYSKDLGEWTSKNAKADISDIAYTLQVGRSVMPHRRMVVTESTEEVSKALITLDPEKVFSSQTESSKRPIAFMFAGGGAQYPNMGLQLYHDESVFRNQVEQCLQILKSEIQLDIRKILYPKPEDLEMARKKIQKPSIALPALFTTSYSLAKLLISWGIEPSAMIGHSMGEYVAACLAGTFSLKDALKLVTVRGQLFETLPEGAMLSVSLSPEELQPMMSDELSFAAINGPQLCVASGPVKHIGQLQHTLENKEIDCRRIKISVAAHSSMIGAILSDFRKAFEEIDLHKPQYPFVSNLRGSLITMDDAVDPEYWVKHLRETVKFSDGLDHILHNKDIVLLEVGPGNTLSSLAKQHPKKKADHLVFSSLRHPKEEIHDNQFLLNLLGKLWLYGVEINWDLYYKDQPVRRLSLPTYPFQRKSYWIDPGTDIPMTDTSTAKKRTNKSDWFYIPSWKRTLPPSSKVPSNDICRVIFHNDEKWIKDISSAHKGRIIQVVTGNEFEQKSEHHFIIDPSNSEHYVNLIRALGNERDEKFQFLHLWSYGDQQRSLLEAKNRSFYSLLYLSQAISGFQWRYDLDIRIITSEMSAIESNDPVNAVKALAMGPLRVIPLELANIRCQVIDFQHGDLEDNLDRLITEVSASIEESVIGYRGPQRYIETFEPTNYPGLKNEIIKLKAGGNYIITGGLGGVAMSIAQRIAKEVPASLVLIGRSEFPDRDQWEQLSQSGSHSKAESINQILDMEKLGTKVMVVSANVSDKSDMTSKVKEIKAQLGPINGVIHAAGVLRDGSIALKSKEDADLVFAPKVEGTLLLDDLLKNDPLDFFILCSALSTVTGSVGQVDYVAANSFLNAFAAQRQRDNPMCTNIAIYWGTWQQVGMAARLGAENAENAKSDLSIIPASAIEVAYNWWEYQWEEGPFKVFKTEYELGKFWVLDEHQIKDGEALIPGSGYMELVRGAIEEECSTPTFKDVFFLSPFIVPQNSKKDLYLKIDTSQESQEFIFYSQSSEGVIEHVRGVVEFVHNARPETYDIVQLLEDCREKRPESLKQDLHLNLGPRWKNFKTFSVGHEEGLCEMELPKEFELDLKNHKLHPALLDVATSGAKPLIPGYDPDKDFHLAFAYGKLTYFAPLEPKLYSYIKFQSENSSKEDMAVFDISVLNTRGQELLRISDFTMKNVGKGYKIMQNQSAPSNNLQKSSLANTVLSTALSEGILPEEGSESFMRILERGGTSQVLVSPIDLEILAGMVKSLSQEQLDSDELQAMQQHSRPQLTTTYVAPRNEIEHQIAEIWEKVLGIEQIGVYDDFFELGGHSLMFTQLISRIRNIVTVEVSFKDLFEKPTIHGIVKKIGANNNTRERQKPKIVKVSRELYRGSNS